MEFYAKMTRDNTFPTHTKVTNSMSLREGDIVYLEVGAQKFGASKKIYTKILNVTNKSIRVVDLKPVVIDNCIHFFEDEKNPVSSHFNNSYNINRKMYLCDRQEYQIY